MRLIINGKAAGSQQLRSAVEQLRSRGHVIEPRVTWEGGDAARLSEEAARNGAGVVVAAGGDGTINEVVNGLMRASGEAKPAVGVVPFGTANDFAHGCGIPVDDPLAALEVVVAAKPIPIDVGSCNDRYFINVASGGFGAEVTAATPPELKKALGGGAYSLMGLVTAMKMSPYHARVTTDGATEYGELFVVAVGNNRQAGGGFQVAPQAILNDGLLDLIGIVDVDIAKIGNVLAELQDIMSATNHFVKYAQLSEFRIESDKPMQMNLDGEPTRDTTFEFRIEPGALNFLLPDDAPLQM